MEDKGIVAKAVFAASRVLRNDDSGHITFGDAEWHKNKDAELAVFSYKRDFTHLWGIRGNGGSLDCEGFDNIAKELVAQKRETKPLTLLIVWDDFPSSQNDAISIGQYVTPIDWAFLLSYIVLKECANETIPPIRIYILDLNPRDCKMTFGFNIFTAIGNSLPWIQIYQLFETDCTEVKSLSDPDKQKDYFHSLRAAVPSGTFGSVGLLKDIIDFKRVLSLQAAHEDRNGLTVFEKLISLWKNNLVGPNTRHSVGNLLAPFLLSEGLPGQLKEKALKEISKEDILLCALQTLVKVLYPGNQSEEITSTPEDSQGIINCKNDIFDRKKNVKILLVDDQFSLGYQHILGYTLFGDEYNPPNNTNRNRSHWSFKLNENVVELACVTNADILFKSLKKDSKDIDWQEPRLLNLPFDILLLDLRLWTESTSKEKFFEELLSKCCELGADKIDDISFKRVYEGIKEKGSQKGSEIEALALFPLLISHYDPSIPIVIFSSTQQKRITDLVAHRYNIITSFSKPIISGYQDDNSPKYYWADLKKALERALELHEIRLAWKELTQLKEDKLEWPNLIMKSSKDKNGKKKEQGPTCSLELSKERINRLATEFIETMLCKRYSDALQVPYNILEVTTACPEKPAEERIEIEEKKANKSEIDPQEEHYPLNPEYFYWSVLAAFRHMRAHYLVNHTNNEDLMEVAIWLWLWFLKGLQNPPFTNKKNYDKCEGVDIIGEEKGLKVILNVLKKVQDKVGKKYVRINDENIIGWLEKLVGLIEGHEKRK